MLRGTKNKKEGKKRRIRTILYSEVIDTPEHARAFLKLNKIKQKEVRAIIIVWEE